MRCRRFILERVGQGADVAALKQGRAHRAPESIIAAARELKKSKPFITILPLSTAIVVKSFGEFNLARLRPMTVACREDHHNGVDAGLGSSARSDHSSTLLPIAACTV